MSDERQNNIECLLGSLDKFKTQQIKDHLLFHHNNIYSISLIIDNERNRLVEHNLLPSYPVKNEDY